MTTPARNMDSVQKVKEYWAEPLSNNFWRKADCPNEMLTEDFCFACGVSGVPLQRAHILTRCIAPDIKASDKAKNLHMLCKWCHYDSEELTGLKYFRWFKNRKFNEGVRSTADRFLKFYRGTYV